MKRWFTGVIIEVILSISAGQIGVVHVSAIKVVFGSQGRIVNTVLLA